MMEFQRLPNLNGLYAKAALKRRSKPTPSTQVPSLEARATEVVVDDLEDYFQICAIADDGHLPPTYPQVLATPLHAAIVAHDDFPLPALGMVHLENRVEQTRPIEVGEQFELSCRLAATEWIAHLGLKFAIDTAVVIDGDEVWKSRLWALSRGAKEELEERPPRDYPTPQPGEETAALASVIIDVPEDMGRRYAAVCGDYNPIHLHWTTSKLFGFKRPIVHGMWTFGRCWAELANFVEPTELSLTVRFKQPLYLPDSMVVRATEVEAGKFSYRATSVDQGRFFLEGSAQSGVPMKLIQS